VAEGYGKRTTGDRAKYYSIALGSLRECQAILDLSEAGSENLIDLADHLGGCLYKLVKMT
jgi:four helix bundle protein